MKIKLSIQFKRILNPLLRGSKVLGMKKFLSSVFANRDANAQTKNENINFWCPTGMIPVNSNFCDR